MIEVSAQIVDATTNQAIPAATIAVNGKAVGAADEDGNFSVALDSYSDQVTASSVGYASLTQPASMVQEAGEMRLGIDAESLAAATVTAPAPGKTNLWPWLILGGVVVAGSGKSSSRAISGRSKKSILPYILVGGGAVLLLGSRTTLFPASSPAVSPYAPTTPQMPGNGSILNNGTLSSLANLFKGLFGGSSDPGFAPVGIQPIPGVSSPSSPAANYPSLPGTAPSIPIDPGAYGDTSEIDDYINSFSLAGIGATTTLNAGDIIGKTLIAAMSVPVYDEARDDAQPSGYISKGNPIGIVYSYLNPDPTQGRKELWWMFEPLPGSSEIGDNLGYYYTPHNPDYFDTQALLDAGVLTVAQATALKQGTEDSTWEVLLKKYGPWVAGILLAGVAVKSVINKAL